MTPEAFEQALDDYAKHFPSELKEKLGSILADVVDRDVAPDAYIRVLCDISDHLRRRCTSLSMTPPLWVEAGGRTCLLSHMDHLRRDVRYALRADFERIGVLEAPQNKIRSGMQFFYIPFKFSSTSTRSIDLLLKDLHHELVNLYDIVDAYVPLRRTMQQRVRAAFTTSKEFREWNVDRVSIGHPERDHRYASSPIPFHDTIIHTDSEGRRHATFTAPQHRILTRETYTNKTMDRCYANLTLNINVFATHKTTGKRVQMTYDYSPLVFTVEMPQSPRFSVLEQPGVTMLIQPRVKRSIHTLRPAQWAAYDTVVVPNVARAAVWMIIHELASGCDTDKDRSECLRALDATVSDVVRVADVLQLLSVRQRHSVEAQRGATSIAMRDLVPLPDGAARDLDCIRGTVRGTHVQLTHPFLKGTRWCISIPDGRTLTLAALVDVCMATIAARAFLNAIIVSHVLDNHPVYEVPFVSPESMHDTFY